MNQDFSPLTFLTETRSDLLRYYVNYYVETFLSFQSNPYFPKVADQENVIIFHSIESIWLLKKI